MNEEANIEVSLDFYDAGPLRQRHSQTPKQ